MKDHDRDERGDSDALSPLDSALSRHAQLAAQLSQSDPDAGAHLLRLLDELEGALAELPAEQRDDATHDWMGRTLQKISQRMKELLDDCQQLGLSEHDQHLPPGPH